MGVGTSGLSSDVNPSVRANIEGRKERANCWPGANEKWSRLALRVVPRS